METIDWLIAIYIQKSIWDQNYKPNLAVIQLP